MPEFQLNRSAYVNGDEPGARTPHPFYSLDDFAKGYVEAMFFTNGDTGNEDQPDQLNELGVERLTKAAVASIKADCDAFQRDNANLLAEAYSRDYDDAQAGRDFWFTRQGHGAGFWDRDALEADGLGTRLSLAAHEMGEAYPEVSRGWIYHR